MAFGAGLDLDLDRDRVVPPPERGVIVGTGWGEVADRVRFRAGDRAGYITGRGIVIDGGLTA